MQVCRRIRAVTAGKWRNGLRDIDRACRRWRSLRRRPLLLLHAQSFNGLLVQAASRFSNLCLLAIVTSQVAGKSVSSEIGRRESTYSLAQRVQGVPPLQRIFAAWHPSQAVRRVDIESCCSLVRLLDCWASVWLDKLAADSILAQNDDNLMQKVQARRLLNTCSAYSLFWEDRLWNYKVFEGTCSTKSTSSAIDPPTP